jgi:hypothetical protein
LAKLSFLFVGVAVVGSLVVAACVGDDPAATSPGTGTEGTLNSECFANGTCSEGLSCTVVQGNAKCVPPSDAAAPTDAASSTDTSTADVVVAPSACVFTPTTFPCGAAKSEPPFACYGAGTSASCTGTLCNVGELTWQCFSRRQCNDVNPCCVTTANATLNAGASCAQGTLAMTGAATTGANCSTSLSCGAGDTQLCQADSHCPPGQ